MSIYEYDQETHMRMEREDAFENGRMAGLEKGKLTGFRELIQKKLTKGKSIEQIAIELESDVSVIKTLINIE